MVPKLNEAREMLKNTIRVISMYCMGKSYLVLWGILHGNLSRKKRNTGRSWVCCMILILSSIQRNTVQNAVSFCGNIMLMNK